MALKAPRILNAPIGCRFSGLIQSGRSASAHRAGISWVRTTASSDPVGRCLDVLDGDQLHGSSVPNGTAVIFVSG